MRTRSRWQRLYTLGIPTALALVVAPVFADAPADQYVPYVRTFTEITDAKTGLVWRRAVLPQRFTFSDASSTPVSCKNDLMQPYRGLPTMKELLTLVDEEPHNEYENGTLVPKAIDRNAFPGTPAAEFWTASEFAPDTSKAWVVDFKTGVARAVDKTSMHYVRCVR